MKVHVKSLGWKTTHPQVWRNVQIKKLGSILILLTKSVLDMDMKLISCLPDQTTNFDFRIYDFFLPISTTSHLSALEIWVFLNQLYFKHGKKKFGCKYQFQLENVKNQVQIDEGYVRLVCLWRRQSVKNFMDICKNEIQNFLLDLVNSL